MFKIIKNFLSKQKTSCSNDNESQDEGKSAIFYALDGETARRTNDLQKALSLFTKAISLDENNDMYYVSRALVFRDMNDYSSALKDIDKALELNGKVNQTHEIKQQILNLANIQ